eukprot:CAMPEP_0175485896 /NCGR_PEP_ID=MMETSP0095-20121207/80758_1 /TAXON_ID=311494 /ORGANISM="Alexandrium monilatum, Strain CCMP3105" /LENGTH=58 /DNA_ID=CAMNT_0016787687 /DNA_START=243 /DNA_END=416 /DNA_ORIENTATION=+
MTSSASTAAASSRLSARPQRGEETPTTAASCDEMLAAGRGGNRSECVGLCRATCQSLP